MINKNKQNKHRLRKYKTNSHLSCIVYIELEDSFVNLSSRAGLSDELADKILIIPLLGQMAAIEFRYQRLRTGNV